MDIFDAYEKSLPLLLERLGKDHPRYAEALTLQARLLENIEQVRRYGDTETRRAERTQIEDALDRLALEAVGESFNGLCGPGELSSTAVPSNTSRSVSIDGDAFGSIIITGDSNVVNLDTPTVTLTADRVALQRVLMMARRALDILEEQAAGFGSLHIPVHLKIEIDEKRKEIAKLEARLKALEE